MPEQVWFITGASSGFGAEFVAQALSRGDKVIATARNISKLQHLEELGASILQLDITAPQANLDAVAAKAIAIYGRIDVLVNNAGYVVLGTIEDTSNEVLQAQFNTNVFGTMKITRSFLPHMRDRRSGTVVFIGSIAAWQGHQAAGPYCSSKYALRGLVESLTPEISPIGIKTLLVEPGYFRTELLNASNVFCVENKTEAYKDLTEEMFRMFRGVDGKQPGDPVKGVSRILDVVRGEGTAEGRGWPGFLALGDDAVEAIRRKCEDSVKVLEEWRSVSTGTNV